MGKSDPEQDGTDFNLLKIFKKTAKKAGRLVLSMAAGGIIVEVSDRRKTTYQKLKSIKPYIEEMGCLGIDDQVPEFVYRTLRGKISEAQEQAEMVRRLDTVEKDAAGVLACVYITRVIKEACSYGLSVNERLKAMRNYIDSVGDLFNKGLGLDDWLIDGIFDVIGADRELASALYGGVDIKKIIKQRFMETKGVSTESHAIKKKSGRRSKAGATPEPVKGKTKPRSLGVFINWGYDHKVRSEVRKIISDNSQELLDLGLIEPGRQKDSYMVVDEAGLRKRIKSYRSGPEGGTELSASELSAPGLSGKPLSREIKTFTSLSYFISCKLGTRNRERYREVMDKIGLHKDELVAEGLLFLGTGGGRGHRVCDNYADKFLKRLKEYGIEITSSRGKRVQAGPPVVKPKQRPLSTFISCTYDVGSRPEVRKIISDNSQELLGLGLIEPGRQKDSYRVVDEAGLRKRISAYRSGGV